MCVFPNWVCLKMFGLRKYLEKAGVLDLLTKSLVQLYEVMKSAKRNEWSDD